MSGNFIANPCRVITLIPSGTSFVDMFTATGYTQLIMLNAANTSASAITISVNYLCFADSTNYRILHSYSLSPSSAIQIPLEGFALAVGDKIQVANSTTVTVHFLLTIAEVPGRSG